MSFYRTILAAVAAIALASPVFADDTTSTNPADTTSTPAAQTTDTSMTQSTADQQQSMEKKINVNTASAKELMKIKGINASKARAIVAYRKKHGNFTSIDDLAKVKGFKKMKSDNMKEIEDQLSID